MRRTLAALTLTVVGMLILAAPAVAASTYASTVQATSSLVSFWRFDEQGAQTDAEGMTLADAQGANPGVYHLGVNLGLPGSLEGDPATAAHFGTPDGYAESPYSSALNSTVFTIEGWVEPDTTAGYMGIVASGAQLTNYTGFDVETMTYYGRPSLGFVFGQGSVNHLINGMVYTPGDWYYFAASYDGTTMRWYVDGQLEGSVAGTYVPNASLPTLFGSGLTGSMDDVAMYNTALGAATIQQHYAQGISDGVPPQTQLESAPAGLTNQTSATMDFAAPSSVDPAYQCQLDGGAWQTCSSPDQLAGLSNGNHRFAVRAINRADQIDPAPPSTTWTVDTLPPVTAFASGPAQVTTSTAATLSFSAGPGSTYVCQLDGTPAVACSSPYSVSGLFDGPHMLAVRATDAAGNVEPTPASYSWSVDTSAPTTFITQAPTAQQPQLPFAFSANEAGITFRCEVDGGPWQTCGSPFTGFSESKGAHTLLIEATNSLGTEEPTPVSYSWTVLADPPLSLRVRFPARIRVSAARKGKEHSHFTWRVTAAATLSLTVVDQRGRRVLHASVSLHHLAGTSALPANLLRKLAPGHYKVQLQARDGRVSSAVVHAAFIVEV